MRNPIDFLNDGKIREITLDNGDKIYIYGVGILCVLVGNNRENAEWELVHTNELTLWRPYIKWKDKKTFVEQEIYLDEFEISKEGDK